MTETENWSNRALREMHSALTDLTALVRDTLPTIGSSMDESNARFQPILDALDAAKHSIDGMDAT